MITMNTLVCCLKCRAHLALSQFTAHSCRKYAASRRTQGATRMRSIPTQAEWAASPDGIQSALESARGIEQ